MKHLFLFDRFFFKNSFVIIISVFVNVYANAKCWRINDDVAKKAHFVSINAAMESENVQDGDTLYIDPGANISGRQHITKQIAVIGCGYFLRNFPYLQSYVDDLWIDKKNVVIKSLHAGNIYITVEKNSIIERCLINNFSSYSDSFSYTIRQCFFSCGSMNFKFGGSYCMIENNIIISTYSPFENSYSSTIRNNYVKLTSSNYIFSKIYSCTITNNILLNSESTNNVFYPYEIKSLFSNNLFSCDEETYNDVVSSCENASFTLNKCLGSNNEENIFAMGGFDDQLYRLKAGSLAIGYGEGGTDCGPYGGAYPYVPSGIINRHPYFKEIDVAPLATDGKINVSLKVKMQDE